ncbi:MAG TPA: hypothetical protein VKB86_01085 [Pyrinomonadaceae bacterium]|nr:hypothetical protein [Pyrinomonadaceae bacterium]
MKSFRRSCATAVLVFAVAFSTYAGEIPCGVTDTPPPPPSSTSQATTTGEIECGLTGDISTGVTATDSTTDTVLNLIQSVLSIF